MENFFEYLREHAKKKKKKNNLIKNEQEII